MYLSLNISVIKCAVCVMFVVFVSVCVYIGIQCDMSVCVYIYKFVVLEYVKKVICLCVYIKMWCLCTLVDSMRDTYIFYIFLLGLLWLAFTLFQKLCTYLI